MNSLVKFGHLRQNMNVIIQNDPLKPKITAAFAAFLTGAWLTLISLFQTLSGIQVLLTDYWLLRYLANPKYFFRKGSSGLLIPYKPLVVAQMLNFLCCTVTGSKPILPLGPPNLKSRKASASTKRIFWISPAFRSEYPRAAAALDAAPCPPWSSIPAKTDFLES